MIFSSDDIEIFGLLDRADVRISQPHKRFVTHFQFDDDLFFFLYFPGHELRACYLYRLDGKNIAREVRQCLIPALLELPEEKGFEELKSDALDHAEQLLIDTRDDASFFDAH